MKIMSFAVIMSFVLVLAGCKAGEEVKNQIDGLSAKTGLHDQKIAAIESELKKTSFELEQTKGVVAKLSDVVIGLQKVGEAKHSGGVKKQSAGKKKR